MSDSEFHIQKVDVIRWAVALGIGFLSMAMGGPLTPEWMHWGIGWLGGVGYGLALWPASHD